MPEKEWSRVQAYLDGLVPNREPELAKMERTAQEKRFPIIGPACGQFCYQIARTMGAKRIFELGSGFGYSTAWFARAVRENGGGEVFHTVWDVDLSATAKDHLEQLGFDDLVRYRVGEAVQTLRETEGPFDLVFNDIDKEGYPAALPVIEEKLRPGGVMIVDNLLWHGRVLDDVDDAESTRGVRELTRLVYGSKRWTASIVPIRDGMLIATLTG